MRFPTDGISTPLVDPLTGREVVIAANRGGRPGAGAPRIEEPTREELDECPFCAGREDRTPPETLRLGDPWRVRVVPNLYPAFERQEVVIHSPRHVRSFAELGDEECALVAEAWKRRVRKLRAPNVLAFINEGRAAGASLAHSHSQLASLPRPAAAGCDHRYVNDLYDDSLIVASRGHNVAIAHPAGRAPYELVIMSLADDGTAFTSPQLQDALFLVGECARRLHAVEGPVPWNAWLHDGPHWHLHVLPRLSVFAGIELGAGIYVNTLPPEEAAAALRAAQV